MFPLRLPVLFKVIFSKVQRLTKLTLFLIQWLHKKQTWVIYSSPEKSTLSFSFTALRPSEVLLRQKMLLVTVKQDEFVMLLQSQNLLEGWNVCEVVAVSRPSRAAVSHCPSRSTLFSFFDRYDRRGWSGSILILGTTLGLNSQAHRSDHII